MAETPAASVQIVIPARNEEDCLGRCLESLMAQKGIDFELTLVDDGSSDATHSIAASFPGVRVLSSGDPAPGVSGKVNALLHGAAGATAKWLLFTDADTFHFPGSLARSVAEAEEYSVDLLSYSPQQETGSWGERALMPLVFADLERVFPTERVSDPTDPAAAANGQYLLVRRETYEALGGHSRVADKLLEDVELARLYKALRCKIRFRQGIGLVSARMYRRFGTMVEGWTKNLALLFPHPLRLAALRSLEFLVIAVSLATAIVGGARRHSVVAILALVATGFFYGIFLRRVLRAHFGTTANLMSFFGLPLFAWLLARSWLHSAAGGAVTWKGRKYTHSAPGGPVNSSMTDKP